MSEPSTLRIRLFGQLELEWDDTPLPPPPSPGARSLLAFLITRTGRSFSRDLLTALIPRAIASYPDNTESR